MTHIYFIMFSLKNNLNALKYTILFSASTHLVILFVEFLRTGNKDLINMFNILDLEFIWPELGTGDLYFWFSYVFIAIVFGISLFVSSRLNNQIEEVD